MRTRALGYEYVAASHRQRAETRRDLLGPSRPEQDGGHADQRQQFRLAAIQRLIALPAERDAAARFGIDLPEMKSRAQDVVLA